MMYFQWLNSAGTGRNGVPQFVSGVPPPEIAVPPPCRSISTTWRCRSVTIVKCSSSSYAIIKLQFKFPEWRRVTVRVSNCIFGKIIIIVATRGQIFRLKCTKFYFADGAYSAPPDQGLAGFKGPTSKGRERGGKGKGAEGKEGKGERKREEM